MSVASKRRRPRVRTQSVGRGLSDGLCLRIPLSACTLAGFREWVKSDEFPEKLPVTFVDQEIYLDMSKEELETHNQVKAEVARGLLNLNRELQLGKFYPDGVLVSNEKAEVSNNPDGTFLSKDCIKSGRVQLVAREGEQGQYLEIVGTPDWVMEVVSKSSVRKDTVQLRAAYHRASIAEYWLIDARGEQIVFHILHWRKKGYAAAPVKDGWQQSKVFGRAFRLTRRRDDLGMWEYTLEIQGT